MNSLPPLSLPRFHVNELPSTAKALNRALPAAQEEEFVLPVEDDAPQQDAQSDLPETPIEPPQPVLPEIDTGTILSSLEAAKTALERTALLHSQELVKEFLQTAFPTLCETLLAEEVVRATAAMMPSEIERLTVKVPAAFEAPFVTALQGSPEMREICEIESIGDADQILIDVNWQTGGLQFDLHNFLESSLARLSGPTHTQEGHNV